LLNASPSTLDDAVASAPVLPAEADAKTKVSPSSIEASGGGALNTVGSSWGIPAAVPVEEEGGGTVPPLESPLP